MSYCKIPLMAAIALLFAGCAAGPDYRRPAVELPANFKEAPQWTPAALRDPAIDEPWWKALGDAELDRLEAEVLIGNENLKAAEAQYRAARAALDSARAGLFPSLNASAAASRGESPGIAGKPGAISNSYALSVAASWEIDLWGRVRRSVESADAKAAASHDDLAAASLSTRALLAQSYVQLRAAELQQLILQKNVGQYRRFLELTQVRQKSGVASALDVAQAETQLASAEAQAIDIANQRAQLEHALAVLLGRPPGGFTLAAAATLPSVPATPRLLPSTVLESRPDIAAAERRMAAANAQIGVAAAAYFPLLTLGGNYGYRGSELDSLISAPNRLWSLGPAAALTLFDAGARHAASEQAIAAYDQAVAVYRQTVLVAMQEVEDNLSAARLLEEEAQAQARALAAARRAREIAEAQYRAGTAAATNVILAQTAELNAEIAALSLASRRLQAAVVLQKNAWASVPQDLGRR